MPELIAKSPLSGRVPLTLGAAALSEQTLGPITSVAPFKGRATALTKALKPLGLTFPAPNRFTANGPACLVWTARDQAFLLGVAPGGLASHAALTDQSDGWAGLRLDGVAAEAVLARLYPLDLRLAAFAVGHAARAPLNHMPSVLLRTEAETFDILVFRSMARTAWHELEAAMKGVAARAAVA